MCTPGRRRLILTASGCSLATLVVALVVVVSGTRSNASSRSATTVIDAATPASDLAAAIADTGAGDDAPHPGDADTDEATSTSAVRALIVGDSLVWTQVDELRDAFADAGVDAQFVGGPGTGLLTAQMAWVEAIELAVDTLDPDIVLIEACCNYGATAERPELSYYTQDGDEVPTDSEAMYELWSDAAARAVEAASAGGADVWWVLTPPLATDSPLAERVERFNRIALNLAGDWPGLRYLDWGRVVTTSSGALLESVPSGNGGTEPLRVDAVHFGPAANAKLTDFTVATVLAGRP
jgi:hypothetical protein